MAFLESRAGGADATSPAGEDTVLAAGVGTPPAAAPGLSNLDLDPEILEVFLLELQELLAAWGAEKVKLRCAPADGAVLAELRRVAHTVKGAANMVGLAALGQLGRQVEQLLDAVSDRGLATAPPVLDFVERSYATLQRLSVD